VPPYWPDHEIVRGDLLDYCAEIDWLDTQLGRALAALDRIGELDDTIVVVTSDNGMAFPRAKVNLYDGGTRMPLAIRWGRRLASPGRKVEEMVSHVDFAPTFLEAAGLPVPAGTAGRSLLPLLTSTEPDPKRDRVYFGLERHTMCRPEGATYPMRAMRTRDRLSIVNFAPDRWPTGGEFLSSNKTTHGDVDGAPIKDFMLAHRREYPRQYELCFGRRPREENYTLATDPHQINPSPGENAELMSYLRATSDPRVEGRDIWQAFPYRQTIGFGASFNTALSEAERQASRDRATHKPE
jgi:N-sulfoglucosamine sulfohydrolase